MFTSDIRHPSHKNKRYYTRAEMQARLDRRLDAIAQKTIGFVSYLDTLTVTSREEFENERAFKDALWQTGPKGVFPWHSPVYDDGCQYHSMRLQLPTPATLACIQYEFNNHHISRGDVALDVICLTQDIADNVYEELSSLFTQPRHGKRQMKRDRRVDYWGDKQARRNIAGYHDRLKVLDLPVAHFDVRLKGGPTCRRRGLDHVANLEWFDITEVLEKDLRLSLFSWKLAEKAMRKEAWRLAGERRRAARRADPRHNVVLIHERLWRRLFEKLGTEDLEKVWAQKIIDAAPWMTQAFVHAPALDFFRPLVIWLEYDNPKFTRNPIILKTNLCIPTTTPTSTPPKPAPPPITPASPSAVSPIIPLNAPAAPSLTPPPPTIPFPGWKSPRWDNIEIAAQF